MAQQTFKQPYAQIVETYTKTYSVTANGTQSVSFSISAKSGWRIVGARKMLTGNVAVLIRGYNLTSGEVTLYVVNISTSALSNQTATLDVIWEPI